ncbi:coth protein-domain-containing protein [Lophiotrema nucula]|uniref:Coth protein-domain-containing protein n=1 Tax=Lophiotrema nucula TaxID=690887 RepID=A0A6A5YZ27_9PLEO|nr:coth protein-domain-containing protein [Lophiotrema nucula]
MTDKQALCDKFYDIDNLITIAVSMTTMDWQALKDAQPRGGRCNTDFTGDRYDWFKANITVSGSKYPKSTSFPGVGIIKKSYCGSFSTSKPAFRLDFGKFTDNGDAIVGLIGTKNVTLNNSIQDSSYVRQPLGYELFRQAGLPYCRCNFAKVVVNGTNMGVYVNVEPIKKRLLQHCFAGNDEGNAYEIEIGEDLDPTVVNAGRISFEGFSDHKNLADLKLAASKVASEGLSGAKQVIDWDQFLKLYAMEFLLKHWDGYTTNKNNTYLYNDTKPVENPTTSNVKFKFIPSGIDQILQEDRDFVLGGSSILGLLMRTDFQKGSNSTEKMKFYGVMRNYATTIFDRDNYEKVLTPLIDRMETRLTGAGVTGISDKISIVKKQLKLVKSGAICMMAELPTGSVHVLNRTTLDCMHASNTEFVAGGSVPNGPFEVYHTQPSDALADRWYVQSADNKFHVKFKNRQYGTWLRCDKSVKTPGDALNVYAAHDDPNDGNNFAMRFTGNKDDSAWHYSGFFVLQSAVTNNYVGFSDSDLTSKGRKEVLQSSSITDLAKFFWF